MSKKQSVNKKLSFVVAGLMLILMLTTFITNAWFTDSKSSNSAVEKDFGTVEIELGGSTGVTAINNASEEINRDLMPGDKLNVTLAVAKADGSEEFYWNARAVLTIKDGEEVINTVETEWNETVYNTVANTEAVTISFELEGEVYGNTYKNKTAVVGYEVRAIQMANLSAEQANLAIQVNSDEVFASGENLSFEKVSEGLTYISASEGNSEYPHLVDQTDNESAEICFVTGIGTCTDTELVIPTKDPLGRTVVGVGENAFKNNVTITSITIPETMTTIYSRAFYGCSAITEINFNATDMTQTWNGSGGDPFDYLNSSGQITVNIGANVTKIPKGLFDSYHCSNTINITEVKFAEGSVCEEIGGNAFHHIAATSMVLPKSLKTIGSSAFSSTVTSIYYEGTEAEWDAITINSYNDSLNNATILYYSESQAAGCWHYVDGVPTAW